MRISIFQCFVVILWVVLLVDMGSTQIVGSENSQSSRTFHQTINSKNRYDRGPYYGGLDRQGYGGYYGGGYSGYGGGYGWSRSYYRPPYGGYGFYGPHRQHAVPLVVVG